MGGCEVFPLGVSDDVLGDLVLSGAPLRVREVHRRAVNLEGPGGVRVSLVQDLCLMGPRSVLVRSLEGLAGDVTVWLPPGPCGLYWPWVDGLEPLGDFRPLWLEWLGFLEDPELSFLRGPVEGGDPMGLVGMGPGHTPAGDDVLTGWLLARRAVGDVSAGMRFLEVFDPRGTSWFSSDQLSCAALGLAWKAARDVLAGLGGVMGRGDLLEAVGRAQAVGHTSGRCCLIGMALGIEGLMAL
ncbi:Protein of unknown function (DUF2877) [Thermanaerovibrio velox DSM 12556]|uniref:DUF2877 domain-containing protein n=1 Tax=Thermanaerovibrio velox DSM 12556 TaxID=926567 RepID=H0UP11_9BACT|nr:DUF2877 domain-containing protein [Thermanaerovibrio velox]EHM10514.1 Protein of unknown function (DUF2877) [Thermanaerovibrio velox DSM 12556]